MTNLKPCPFCGGEVEIDTGPRACNPLKQDGSDRTIVVDSIQCHECEFYFEGTYEGETARKWNTRASAWISVEDRLPEEGTSNLMLVTDGDDFELAFASVQTDGSAHWFFEENDRIPERLIVTHWQPLPDPPEKVENK